MYSAIFIFLIRKLINMLFLIAINYDNIKDEKSLIKRFTFLIFNFIYCLDIINIIDAIKLFLGFPILDTVYLDGGCRLEDSFQAGGKQGLLYDATAHYWVYLNDVNRNYHRDFLNAIYKLMNHDNPRLAITYDDALSIKYFGSKYGYSEYTCRVLGGFSNGKDFGPHNRPKIYWAGQNSDRISVLADLNRVNELHENFLRNLNARNGQTMRVNTIVNP